MSIPLYFKFQDDVFGDEYHGLWKVCYDRPNRGLTSSCFERVGDGKLLFFLPEIFIRYK